MRYFLLVGTAVLARLGAFAALAQAPAPPPIEISDPGPRGIRINRDGIFANYFPGKGGAKRPGVLLLAGSEAGLGFGTVRIAQALAAEGFSILQLCYFGCPDLPPKLVNVPLETFSAGLDWLKRQPDIDGTRIAILGGSKGAEAALLTASRASGIKAVIATQPSSVVWPGIAYSDTIQPGWTEKGNTLPYLPYANVPIAQGNLFARYDGAMPSLPEHADAVIRVERIDAPILLVCGEADTLWPSCKMADQIALRRKQAGKSAPEILRYPDAGHEVFGLPIDASDPHYAHLGGLGGTPAGIAAAHADDWPKTVAFLKEKLL